MMKVSTFHESNMKKEMSFQERGEFGKASAVGKHQMRQNGMNLMKG